MAGNSIESGRSVTSKIVAILMTFVDSDAHTLTEVARRSGIPTSTVHRLIGELTASGVLERTDGSRYRIGLPLKEVCLQAAREPNLHERARRVMEDLSVVAHVPVRLGVLVDRSVHYVEKSAMDRPVSHYSDSYRAPVHATSMGKALLAFSPPITVEAVLTGGLKAYTTHTLTNADELRKALSAIRLSRIAVSRWEWVAGVSTFAVPVFGGGGRVVAALELTVRDLRADLKALHPALTMAARGLSRELASGAPYDANALAHRSWGRSPVPPMAGEQRRHSARL